MDTSNQDVICPSCYSYFPSEEGFLDHIDVDNSACIRNLEQLASQLPASAAAQHQIPVPPAFLRGPRDSNVSVDMHPTSGYVFPEKGETLLDRLKTDEYERRREQAPHYPFRDEEEWALAKFLALHFTKSEVSEFLKLKWVQKHPAPSFNTADKLFGWLGNLPRSAQWQSSPVTLDKYTATRPIKFLYRNTLEVVQELFSNPMFERYMTYDPHVVMQEGEREYSEFFTGTHAFDIQNHLPVGATMIPIILASDKTPVTRQTGGLEMHPVFMTIGNIQSDVRMQATSHAWRCIAFIPTPEFDIRSDFKTLLLARLFHKCMDKVTEPLKVVAKHGADFSDASGHVRRCFTPLAAYVCDLPEAQLVAVVAANASPTTLAEKSGFGNAEPAEPRTGRHTLSLIFELCLKVDPWENLDTFQKEAKRHKLLGVHLPFWRNWRFADPSLFLTGEILHTCHKFFFDHVLAWSKKLAGEYALDTRFKSLHRRVGMRHFSSGVCHVVQMTGRDHRDIQRSILPVLVGIVPDQFIPPIRAILEFIYFAQDPVHTDSSVLRMEDALQRFHAGKQVILDLGARTSKSGPMDHFNIPKLELMQSFARQTRANGALIQFTADVTERLLINHCKNVFPRTSRNHSTFLDQSVEILNREEAIHMFDLYLILRQAGDAWLEQGLVIEDEEITTVDPALSFLRCVLPEKESTFHGPRPFRNYFKHARGLVSPGGSIAFHVTLQPDHQTISIPEMQNLFKLSHFSGALTNYIHFASNGTPTCEWDIRGKINAWNKFRIQMHSSFRSRTVNRSQVVQAFPPSDRYPLGYCDAVLLGRQDRDEISGNVTSLLCTCPTNPIQAIAQVRVVFAPKARITLPDYLGKAPLLYVQYYRIVSSPSQNSLGLYQVRRMHHSEPHAYGIVPLTDVVLAVDLVPIFGTALPGIVACSETCMEGYTDYYLNSFTDKDTFHLLRHLS